VREVIQNFVADFDLMMGLAGCASLAEIDLTSVTADGATGTHAAIARLRADELALARQEPQPAGTDGP
jgi:hypothetical protein